MSQKKIKLRYIVILFLGLLLIPPFFIDGFRSYLLLPANTIGPIEPRTNTISFNTQELTSEIKQLNAEIETLKNEKLKLINYYDREYTQKWSLIETYLKQAVINKKGEAFADDYLKSLSYITPLEWLPVSAQVVGEHMDQWDRNLEVNRGSKHGIEKGYPVVSGACIVGQVIAVTPWTCTIGHITNESVKIPCVLANSENLRGLMVGIGRKVKGEYTKINYLDRRGNIEIGQKVFSLGISEKYPGGFLLGTIRKKAKKDSEMYYAVEMEPAIPFYLISDVIILKPVDSK
jgi:rod shape-determining protein MreC